MGLARVAPSRQLDPPNEPRFILLHVVREYAAEELDAHEEHAATMQRLSGWCMSLVQESYKYAGTDDVMAWMDRVEASYPDLRAVVRDAMDRGDVPTVWSLIAHLNTFWLLRGYRGEALDWLRKTGLDQLAADPASFRAYPPILLGGVLFAAGTMCYYAEHLDVGVTYLERAVEQYSAPDIPHQLVFYGWLFMGMARIGANDPKAAWTMERALQVARQAGDRFLEAMALCYGNEAYVRQGDLQRAQADLGTAAGIAKEIPRQLLSSSLQLAQGNLNALMGRYEEALALYAGCLSVSAQHRIAGTVGWALNGSGFCLIKLGRHEEAYRFFMEGIESARLGGYRAALMAQWMGLAWLAALRGDHRRGARLLGAADALRSSIRYTQWTVTRQVQLGAREAVAAALSPEVMEQEVTIGRNLPMEEVLALTSW
jgi:tetratricopeptide (TPR) repeat protein